MRAALLILLVACGGAPAKKVGTFAPPPEPPPPAIDPTLEPLRPLLGAWEGVDNERGTKGRFTVEPDLEGKVLVRRNVDETMEGRHEDLMILFHAPTGLRASYFDNEGHAITYAVTASGDRIQLVSDEVPGQPRFKLTYDVHGADELAVDFAIAMPGSTEFKHYTGGTVHRVGKKPAAQDTPPS